MGNCLRVLGVCIAMLLGAGASATTLTSGSMAFTSYNSDDTSDAISFVLLTDISGVTTLRFTDNGWKSDDTFRTGEGDLEWTYNGSLTSGTQVSIELWTGITSHGVTSTVSGTSPSLSTSGDQVFAYTGTLASPTIIAGIHANYITSVTTDGDWDGDSIAGDQSALPPALTNGFNALRIYTGANVEVDNAQYNCAVIAGDVDTVRSAVNNIANWNTNNTTLFEPPAPCTITVPVSVSRFLAE